MAQPGKYALVQKEYEEEEKEKVLEKLSPYQ